VAQAHHTGNGSNPGSAIRASNGYVQANGGYIVSGVWGNNFGTRLWAVFDDWATRWYLPSSQPNDAVLINQEICMYLASNTSLRIRVKGSDGTVRAATITLS
jgi:hypothetical protein